MINNDMRFYDYFLYGEYDAYGQPTLTPEAQGSIKMAVNIASQNVRDSATYSGTELIGLTMAQVDDKYVISYEGAKYKVLYVNPQGRYKVVYMSRV